MALYRSVELGERIHVDAANRRLSLLLVPPAWSSTNTRGATKPVLVVERKTRVIPFGDGAMPVRSDEKIEARGRSIHFAERSKAVGAQIDDLIDPEPGAEIRNLHDDGTHVERERAAAIGDVLIRARDRSLRGIDVVRQHREPVDRRDRQNAVQQARVWTPSPETKALVIDVDHRPGPEGQASRATMRA